MGLEMRSLRCLALLFVSLVAVMLVNSQFGLIHPAYASPSSTYTSRPTADAIGVISVTNPENAYDGIPATSASFQYGAKGAAYFELKNFTKLPPETWRITRVDIYIRYSAEAGANDDYRIVYQVASSGVSELLTWNRYLRTLKDYSWLNRMEPNDRVWSWTDVYNLKVRFEVRQDAGADKKWIYVHEVWAVVHYRSPTVFVDPSYQEVSAPFTMDINITNADDIYGWQLYLAYNTTAFTATSATEGAFLQSGGSTQFNKTINDTYNSTHGIIYAYCSLLNDTWGVTGSGTLATINLNIDASATADKTYPMDLFNVTLVEYDFLSKTTYNYPPYGYTVTDGSVKVLVTVPEFPLGASIEIALAIVIIYVGWKSKHKTKPHHIPSSHSLNTSQGRGTLHRNSKYLSETRTSNFN